MSFHEVRFPTGVSLGSLGGPERVTEVVQLASGAEERNTPHYSSRRRYDAGYGIATLDDMHAVIAFFEARRGRLYGFRFRDPFDFRSCPPLRAPAPSDQVLGLGYGQQTDFPLIKTYSSGAQAYTRRIHKPVAGSVRVAVAGTEQTDGWSVDTTTGIVTFTEPPGEGAEVTAGFEFDVPVRFDTDRLDLSLALVQAGRAPSLPLLELLLTD